LVTAASPYRPAHRAPTRGRNTTLRAGAIERLRFEVRRAGTPALALPPLLLIFGIIVLIIQDITQSPINHLAASWVEGVLPLGVGITASMLVGTDPALELQLSLPSQYRITLGWRAAICVAWSALFNAGFAAVVDLSGIWPIGIAKAEVSWVVVTAVLVVTGLAFSGLFGDGRTGAVAVGAVWVAQEGLKDWFESHAIGHPFFLFATSRFETDTTNWAANRLTLTAIAAAIGLGAWIVLGRSHRLFRKAD
jgi:uncharacterized integral membrane protein